MKMNVMLMAAGEGTRLRPYTLTHPKPAIPFLGAPLVAYALAFIETLEVQNLVVNIHHLPEALKLAVEKLKPRCQNLIFSDESKSLLNSGGGIRKALEFLQTSDPFLMMNADEILIPFAADYMQKFVAQHMTENAIATLMVMKHPEVGHKFGGAWTRDSKNVIQFAKKKTGEDLEGHHFIGPILFSPRIAHFFKPIVDGVIAPENILYDTLTTAIAAGEKVQIHSIDCVWFESGNREDFLSARDTLKTQRSRMPSEFAKHYLEALLQKFGGQKEVIS